MIRLAIHERTSFLLKISLLILPVTGWAQTKKITLANALSVFYKMDDLPEYNEGTVEGQQSTYDRTGGNDDGFNGTWSFVRRNPDSSLVMIDLDGPGVINRFATPTPTSDTLDIFIDDTSRPVLSVNYMDLFSGKVYPFISPLCGQGVGGYYNYFPLLFQRHCRIVSRGKHLQFHQIQYRLFREGTRVESFSPVLSSAARASLQEIAAVWSKPERTAADFSGGHIKTISNTAHLQPDEAQTIAVIPKGGRITGITMEPATAFAGMDKSCSLRITWDGETTPAVDCPVSDFFGYAFGSPSMQSLLIGSRNGQDYCYFPMPFDSRAKIELVYKGNGPTKTIRVAIQYTDKKRDAENEGRFAACYRRDSLSGKDPFHVFLQTAGRGHLVGVALQAQGYGKGLPLFFEGDDTTATDGVFRIHGTGSEDYFNGGWYDLKGRWDTAHSMPLSGCLDYSHVLERTGGYRLYLSDKLPFEHSIFHAIEHGSSAAKAIPALYTSVSYYYVGPERN